MEKPSLVFSSKKGKTQPFEMENPGVISKLFLVYKEDMDFNQLFPPGVESCFLNQRRVENL